MNLAVSPGWVRSQVRRVRHTVVRVAPPRGTWWVAVGTAVLGISGYAFLTLTARLVPPTGYAALASLYLLVALVGPGLFLPIEQETSRLVSRGHALGHGTRTVVTQMASVAAAVLTVGVIALALLGPLLTRRVFHGQPGLWVALVASVIGYGGACLVRGVFAGQRRFRGYAACVGVDGAARLLPCAGLALAGVATTLPYGFALGLGPVAAFVAVLPWFRGGRPGPPAPWRALIGATSWLIAAWGLSFTLANIAPVIVTGLLPGDPARAGVFAFVFVIARVPLFLLLSVQAMLLPALSRAAATEDVTALRRGVRQALVLVAGLAAVTLVATAPLCRVLLGLLFHAPAMIGIPTLTLLAVGTIFAMLVQVLQPALIAVAGHRVVAAAWLAGAVCFAVAFALPVGVLTAATLAQLAAGVATATVLALALARHLRGRDLAAGEVAA